MGQEVIRSGSVDDIDLPFGAEPSMVIYCQHLDQFGISALTVAFSTML